MDLYQVVGRDQKKQDNVSYLIGLLVPAEKKKKKKKTETKALLTAITANHSY